MYVKKIASFRQLLKKMHTNKNWFLCSASMCSSFTLRVAGDVDRIRILHPRLNPVLLSQDSSHDARSHHPQPVRPHLRQPYAAPGRTAAMAARQTAHSAARGILLHRFTCLLVCLPWPVGCSPRGGRNGRGDCLGANDLTRCSSTSTPLNWKRCLVTNVRES